ncbi:hypothetical protein [Mariprofundus micogutta]|nr:hypothetical protein [Mariprofundus micogutta]
MPHTSFLAPPAVNRPMNGQPVHAKPEPVQQLSAPEKTDKASGLWEEKRFGFGDFLDMINPLQHLPVISTIYRKISGDEIGDAPRVIGGAIFGGVLGSLIGGLASALVNVFSSRTTGKDIGEHMVAATTSTHAKASSPVAHTGSEADSLTAAVTPPPPRHVSIQPTVQMQPEITPATAQARPIGTSPASPAQVIQSVSSLKASEIHDAIGQYRQQMILDDIRRETSYWA